MEREYLNIPLADQSSANEVVEERDVEAGEGKRRELAAVSSSPGSLCSVGRFCVVMFVLAVASALTALIAYFFSPGYLLQLALVLFVAYFASAGGFHFLYVALATAPRDLTSLVRYIRILLRARSWNRNKTTIASNFSRLAAEKPSHPCFYFEENVWTRQQVEEYSNRVANVMQARGLKKGDCVALLMTNRPEMVCIWLGLAKLGVISSLINNNLRLHSLLHCIRICQAKALVFEDCLSSAVKEICQDLNEVEELFCWSREDESHCPESETCAAKQLKGLLDGASAEPPRHDPSITFSDKLLYIYTSGTTGLPKAAVITNSRYMTLSTSSYIMVGITSKDKVYTSLPLYHTAGGCLGVGLAIVFGGSTVIRTKFSASNFFPDIVKYNCTVAQYIGEMCRYLLATPPKPEVEQNHKLKFILGNGLRPQIWREFTERFNIPQVAEFYGATEGNANIINVDNREGAIGFISRVIPSIYPVSIIRVDELTGEPIRDSRGLCQVCKPGEPGAFVGKIVPNHPMRQFHGYVNQKDSQKKVVSDVFRKGDQAFMSGDILEYDELGYLYFKDRTGDTFRWKGENVSTSEVEAVMSNISDYRDCVVYGVTVAHAEGRAGMAAIVDCQGSMDMANLSQGVNKCLPTYARPLFLRIMSSSMEMTGTFKMKKTDLQKEGYDPSVIKDRLYYLSANSTYQPLDNEIFSHIESGRLRL